MARSVCDQLIRDFEARKIPYDQMGFYNHPNGVKDGDNIWINFSHPLASKMQRFGLEATDAC